MPSSLPIGVSLRGSVYQLRIGIPDDLRHLFPRQGNGKPAVDAHRASLKTSDRNEAAARAHQIIAEWKRKFEDMRTSMRPAPFTPITDALVTYICDRETQTILAFDDGVRSNVDLLAELMRSNTPQGRGWLSGKPVRSGTWDAVGSYMGDAQFESLSGLHRAIVYGIRTDLQRGRLDTAQQAAQNACDALGIVVDWTQPSARMALSRVMRAILKAWEAVESRDSGEAIDTPTAPEKPATIAPVTATPVQSEKPKTLRDALPYWVRFNAPREDSIGRAEKALALFEEAVGLVPLADLSKGTGARFVHFLLDEARPFGRKTAHNHASYITAIANAADKADLIERNPMDLSFDKTIGAEQREPWTDAELATIYSSLLFSSTMAEVPHWRDVTTEDGRAALLLLLHTGARAGEIAQLRREDFLTRTGVRAIRITAEAGTVKNKESERVVPLADHLLSDPWFSQWLDGVEGSTGPAMPSLHGRSTPPGDVLGRWFLQFRKAYGLPTDALSGAHKYRHWIRTALAEQHVGEATADAITGHSATGSSGRKIYTAQASLRTMKKALDSLSYPATSRDAERGLKNPQKMRD